MLSFQQLQEKKTKIKINPKKEEMMEKSDVIDSGTSTEEPVSYTHLPLPTILLV